MVAARGAYPVPQGLLPRVGQVLGVRVAGGVARQQEVGHGARAPRRGRGGRRGRQQQVQGLQGQRETQGQGQTQGQGLQGQRVDSGAGGMGEGEVLVTWELNIIYNVIS